MGDSASDWYATTRGLIDYEANPPGRPFQWSISQNQEKLFFELKYEKALG